MIAAPLFRRGKVRDMYELDAGRLLMVASDRVSAFDVVMNEPIPGKGAVLTALSRFWFSHTAALVPNHVLDEPPPADVADRAIVVQRAERIDIECVVRGYLAGSAWTEYRATGCVALEPMPSDLVESDRFSQPIFTPAIKAETGHDENISRSQLRSLVGADVAERLEQLSRRLYEAGAAHALSRGVILADTKFEFGWCDGQLIVIDELLTPDSSRYWPLDEYRAGGPQPSFDKQFLRDFLESSGWNKQPPPPPLPPDVINGTAARYQEALRRLTA
ncbi:MAG TPA: phosphoribosylaminoimidazolesuccinocarboxamide synthase [Chloroflexota bacterium]